MAMSSTYKPSPLSYGSPRTSPFRRPESPASQLGRSQSPSSPSLAIRPTTPTLSPTKAQPQQPSVQSPSPTKLHNASTPTSDSGASWAPRGLHFTKVEVVTSPTRNSSAATTLASYRSNASPRGGVISSGNGDAISKLPAPKVRELREGFQTLDRDNDGLVGPDDVVDMLNQLGQPSGASDVSSFFPLGAPQKLPLPSFLSTLATLLAPLSGQQELLNAFAAFDDHDSGEIDVHELMDALMHTAPEPGEKALSEREVHDIMDGFTGRRAFGKGMGKVGLGGLGTPAGKGEVFRYREWVGGILGTADEKQND